MNPSNSKTLGLFFTQGVSVELWSKLGLLDREKIIYEELLNSKKFDKVYWFTYGAQDNNFRKNLHENIKIVEMPRVFSSRVGKILYSLLLPVIKRKEIKCCSVLKTNQMWGSWAAVISKILYKKPLFLRTGYTLSRFMDLKKNKLGLFKAQMVEKFAYAYSDIAQVSSHEDKEYISSKYKTGKVVENPNYINTEKFTLLPKSSKSKDLITVGRLNSQKNLFNLIEAVSELDCNLDIFGEGELKNRLEDFIEELNISNRVRFQGLIENDHLPSILNSYKIFILPSLYEGMPKALLEAMSCGLCVIGSNVSGIKEVISHNNNGILCDTSIDSIKKAISSTLKNDELIKTLGEKARQTIEDNYSVVKYLETETQVYKELL